MASVIGDVTIGANVMVSPLASVRGDEGMPIFIGKDSNVQDGIVIHGLETIDDQGKSVENNLVAGSDGKNTLFMWEKGFLLHISLRCTVRL